MSQQIRISADSTCDLSPALLRRYGISVTPLYINMGGRAYRDGIDMNQEDIYRYVRRKGELPKTSAVTVQDYLDFFGPIARNGQTVIHFTISRSMSSCYQNAVAAAKETGNVHVVDSQNLSTGIGLLVLRAAELAALGAGTEEILRAVGRLVPKVEASFVIDTLHYLHKGGRCSSVAALGANLLSLKPCIEVKGGAMEVGKKYRGTLRKCLQSYVTDRLKSRTDLDLTRVFITHSVMPDGFCQDVADLVAGLAPFQEILDTDAGCTVCNHCGPGTLGVLFLRK